MWLNAPMLCTSSKGDVRCGEVSADFMFDQVNQYPCSFTCKYVYNTVLIIFQ